MRDVGNFELQQKKNESHAILMYMYLLSSYTPTLLNLRFFVIPWHKLTSTLVLS